MVVTDRQLSRLDRIEFNLTRLPLFMNWQYMVGVLLFDLFPNLPFWISVSITFYMHTHVIYDSRYCNTYILLCSKNKKAIFICISDEALTCNVCDRSFPTRRQLGDHQQKKRHFGWAEILSAYLVLTSYIHYHRTTYLLVNVLDIHEFVQENEYLEVDANPTNYPAND